MTAELPPIAGFQRWRIVQFLERDRFLSIATAILSVAVLFPLTQTPILPLNDLPNHMAMTSMMRHLLAGDPVAKEHFEILLIPAPYWVTYLLMLLTSYVMPVLLASKVVVAVALLSVPLGTMRLLKALGRSPRLGLWAFAVSWEFSLSMGFISYSVALGLAFFYVARVVDTMDGAPISRRNLVITILLGLLLGQSHAHVTGFTSVLVFALALTQVRTLKPALRTLLFSALPTAGLIPWVLMGSRAGGNPRPASIGFWPDVAERIVRMFPNSLDLVNGEGMHNLFGAAFLFLLIVPLLMGTGGNGLTPSDIRARALYLAGWLLYLVMPSAIDWPFYQILIYERHATPILLLGLLFPLGSFTGRSAWRLAPGIAVSLALCAAISWQCSQYANWVKPLLPVIDAVKPGSKIAWVLWQQRTPESVRDSIPQIPAYIVAEKGGYAPYLFENANIPFRYKDNKHLPHTHWHHPEQFTLQDHGVFYDYVLVQGKDSDRYHAGPIQSSQGNFRATIALESGIWRLYAISKEPQ